MKNMMIKENYETSSMDEQGYYSSFKIAQKNIPELKGKEIGGTCKLMIEVEITGINADKNDTFYNVDVKEGKYYEEKE